MIYAIPVIHYEVKITLFFRVRCWDKWKWDLLNPVSTRLQCRAQGPSLEGLPLSHASNRSELLKKSWKKAAGRQQLVFLEQWDAGLQDLGRGLTNPLLLTHICPRTFSRHPKDVKIKLCSLWHGFKVWWKLLWTRYLIPTHFVLLSVLGSTSSLLSDHWRRFAPLAVESTGHLCNLLVTCLQAAYSHLFLAEGTCHSFHQFHALPAQCQLSWGGLNSGHWVVVFGFFFSASQCSQYRHPEQYLFQAPQGLLGCSGSPATEKL